MVLTQRMAAHRRLPVLWQAPCFTRLRRNNLHHCVAKRYVRTMQLILPDLQAGSLADWVSGISSFFAVVIALSGYAISAWKLNKDQFRRDRTVAIGIVIKVKRIFDTIFPLEEKFNNMIIAADEQKIMKWQVFQPVIGPDFSLFTELNSEEVAIIYEMGDPELLNSYYHIQSGFKALGVFLERYTRKRQEYISSLKLDATSDTKASLKIPVDDLGKEKVIWNEFEYMVSSIFKQTQDTSAQGRLFIERFCALTSKKYKFFIEIPEKITDQDCR